MQSKSKKISAVNTPSKSRNKKVIIYAKGTPLGDAMEARGIKLAPPPVVNKKAIEKANSDRADFFAALNPPVKPRSPFEKWTVALELYEEMLAQPSAVAVVSKQLARAARRARASA